MAPPASPSEGEVNLQRPPAGGPSVLPCSPPTEPAAAPPPTAAVSQPVLWATAVEVDEEDEEEEELVPRTPVTAIKTFDHAAAVDATMLAAPNGTASSAMLPGVAASAKPRVRCTEAAPASLGPSACACVQPVAEECDGWQEVLRRHGSRRPTSLFPSAARRPVPGWLPGRCCRCLSPEHRAAACGDPFRCYRCLENGHPARECRNAWRPLSLLASLIASSPPRPAVKLCEAPAPRQTQLEASLPSKALHHASWALVLAASAGSLASTDMSLRSSLEGQAELLRSELLGVASFQLDGTVQPLCDVIASMQGWMLRIGGFLERAEAALDRLSLASPVLQTASGLRPLVVPDVDIASESGATIYGCFSPHAKDSSTVMSPVLNIMPELKALGGESVLPLSVEKVNVDSLEISDAASQPSETLDFEESGDVDCGGSPPPESIGHVVPIGDVVAKSGASTRVPGSFFAKEFCDFLATLAAANPGSDKTIGCLLKEKANKDKRKSSGASSRSVIVKEKSNKCRSKKNVATGKTPAVA